MCKDSRFVLYTESVIVYWGYNHSSPKIDLKSAKSIGKYLRPCYLRGLERWLSY